MPSAKEKAKEVLVRELKDAMGSRVMAKRLVDKLDAYLDARANEPEPILAAEVAKVRDAIHDESERCPMCSGTREVLGDPLDDGIMRREIIPCPACVATPATLAQGIALKDLAAEARELNGMTVDTAHLSAYVYRSKQFQSRVALGCDRAQADAETQRGWHITATKELDAAKKELAETWSTLTGWGPRRYDGRTVESPSALSAALRIKAKLGNELDVSNAVDKLLGDRKAWASIVSYLKIKPGENGMDALIAYGKRCIDGRCECRFNDGKWATICSVHHTWHNALQTIANYPSMTSTTKDDYGEGLTDGRNGLAKIAAEALTQQPNPHSATTTAPDKKWGLWCTPLRSGREQWMTDPDGIVHGTETEMREYEKGSTKDWRYEARPLPADFNGGTP
jgi:hypothetical protein